jgi:pimeloyl-ACP methyl ester carboxylesterase
MSKKLHSDTPKFCVVREAMVSYTDTGSGFPNVVLLHGFLENKTIWAGFTKMLSTKFRIITIDLPGHGSSEEIGYYHPMELMANVVLGVMKHLRLRRYFIVGHSMGGYVGLAFLELYPQYLKGFVLFNSTAYSDSDGQKKIRDRAVKLVKRNHQEYTKATLLHFFSPKVLKRNERVISKMIATAGRMTPKGIVASIFGMKDRPDRLAVMREQNLPILIIGGVDDQTVPITDLRTQHDSTPNSELVEIEKCGHFGYLEQPELCLLALKKFILKNRNNV